MSDTEQLFNLRVAPTINLRPALLSASLSVRSNHIIRVSFNTVSRVRFSKQRFQELLLSIIFNTAGFCFMFDVGFDQKCSKRPIILTNLRLNINL